jgi:hypothetical protein
MEIIPALAREIKLAAGIAILEITRRVARRLVGSSILEITTFVAHEIKLEAGNAVLEIMRTVARRRARHSTYGGQQTHGLAKSWRRAIALWRSRNNWPAASWAT